jgi:hypothetical protein
MAGTTKVRVRQGQTISQGGRIYKGGDEFEIPTRILSEFHWQLEEVGADGEGRPVRSIHIAGADAPHERKAVLEQQLETARADVSRLEAAIAAEDEAIATAQSEAAASQEPVTDADQAQEQLNREQTENLTPKGSTVQAPAGHPSSPTAPPTEEVGRQSSAPRQSEVKQTDQPVEHVDEAAKGGRVHTERVK